MRTIQRLKYWLGNGLDNIVEGVEFLLTFNDGIVPIVMALFIAFGVMAKGYMNQKHGKSYTSRKARKWRF